MDLRCTVLQRIACLRPTGDPVVAVRFTNLTVTGSASRSFCFARRFSASRLLLPVRYSRDSRLVHEDEDADEDDEEESRFVGFATAAAGRVSSFRAGAGRLVDPYEWSMRLSDPGQTLRRGQDETMRWSSSESDESPEGTSFSSSSKVEVRVSGATSGSSVTRMFSKAPSSRSLFFPMTLQSSGPDDHMQSDRMAMSADSNESMTCASPESERPEVSSSRPSSAALSDSSSSSGSSKPKATGGDWGGVSIKSLQTSSNTFQKESSHGNGATEAKADSPAAACCDAHDSSRCEWIMSIQMLVENALTMVRNNY